MVGSLLSLPTRLGLALHSADDLVMIRVTEAFVGDIRRRGRPVGCWGWVAWGRGRAMLDILKTKSVSIRVLLGQTSSKKV